MCPRGRAFSVSASRAFEATKHATRASKLRQVEVRLISKRCLSFFALFCSSSACVVSPSSCQALQATNSRLLQSVLQQLGTTITYRASSTLQRPLTCLQCSATIPACTVTPDGYCCAVKTTFKAEEFSFDDNAVKYSVHLMQYDTCKWQPHLGKPC